MTKKRTLLGLAALLAIVICVTWLALRPRQIGSMNYHCSHPESSASNITFSAQPGEDFGIARELRTYITLEQPGPYRLEAKYQDFVGYFQVVLSAHR